MLKTLHDLAACKEANVSCGKGATFNGSVLEVHATGKFSCGNDCSFTNVKISIRENASLSLGYGCSLRGRIIVEAGSHIVIGHGLVCAFFNIKMHANEGASIHVGNDCLFSNVEVYNSDMHSIFDVATGERINPAKHVNIGDRVWLAADVRVLKGANISRDTVVGAGSVVTGSHPPNVILAGNPAKVVRQGVRWTRPTLQKMPMQLPSDFSLAGFRASATVFDHQAVIDKGLPYLSRYAEGDISNAFIFYYTARSIYESYFNGKRETVVSINGHVVSLEMLHQIFLHVFQLTGRTNCPCASYAYLSAVDLGKLELAHTLYDEILPKFPSIEKRRRHRSR